jgi:16S rRNA (cytosine(1402)-N(4))-methyltransferase
VAVWLAPARKRAAVPLTPPAPPARIGRRRRPEAELGRILRDYGEERKWRAVAKRLVTERIASPLRTTTQLTAAVAAVVGFGFGGGGGGKGKGIHPATRTYQALRIAVNSELAVIEAALPAAINALAPGGRLAVISFHSLEDRIVKHLFREAAGKARGACAQRGGGRLRACCKGALRALRDV